MKKLLWLLLFGAFLGTPAHQAQAQVVVIANSGVPASTISKADLRDLFAGTSTSFNGGSTASPVLLREGALHIEFLALYIGKSDAAFRATWRSIVFSGQGVMPRTFDSETAVVDYVNRTPGAIGYIGKSTPHEGVKVLLVR